MYSFGPLPKVGKSGRIIGTHQKIDRVARRHFVELETKKCAFPDIRTILRFEGINGPDGVKLKSPGVDEPWHFINPEDPDDTSLRSSIKAHSANLTLALQRADHVRAGFEAAWLAHAVVDGLTPAHHDPSAETFDALREKTEAQRTVRSRLILSGDGSKKQFVKNNWEHWGAGGTMTTHTMFEAGVATTVKALRFETARPSSNDIVRLKTDGFMTLFDEALAKIAQMDLYETYKRRGWTRRMAQHVRGDLMPIIITMVILAWYAAYWEAMKKRSKS